MESLNDDETLTKPKQKKPRTEAQQEATKKMLSAMEEKKMKLKAIKDKLNNAPPIDKTDNESDSEPEPVVVKKAKAEPKAVVAEKPVSKAVSKPKKEPKVIYESASESEEEIVIVKKKKKPKKKTIIYEEESESEEEAPKPKPRETKTQQSKSSFKVTPGESKPAPPKNLYYFAE
jgi:hypothetical protein